MTRDEIKHFELFDGMPDDEIDWMLANGEIVTLENGTTFQHQDDPPIGFYVTLVGEMQVTRTVNGIMQVLGTNPPGVMGNEIAILRQELSLVDVTAIMLTRILVLDEPTFRQLFVHAPTIGARIMHITMTRLGGISRMIGQREKNAALGRLSAGLAHELNNPASAARRSAQELRALLPAVQHYTLSLNLFQMGPEQVDHLFRFQERILEGDEVALNAMQRADIEEAIAAWMDSIGLDDAYDRAGNFAARGMTRADLETLSEAFTTDQLAGVIRWLDASLSAVTLMQTIDSSTQRISALVDAVKAYTYMDQGETQRVDIHAGIDAALFLLRQRLGNRTIVRQFDPALPQVTARGSEINEIWSQLIDNAIDATADDGAITIITRPEHRHVMIEIADNGRGIPDEVLPNIFEPFFTTKILGEGIGLGLEIVNRIITGHRGTIEMRSIPGHTRAIVRLPIQAVGS